MSSQIAAQLAQQVQYNCDIADAHHAGDYTLCIYLLKMRELYRWNQSLGYQDKFDNDSMSQWLRDKEEIWDEVIDQPLKPLEINGQSYDLWDAEPINQSIQPYGLFYHAGIGNKAAQHFFLAELIDQYDIDDMKVFITGKELARDLISPPAVSNQNVIIIRQESLKRLCWERYQEWSWSSLKNPMGKALSYYPFAQSIDLALTQMVQNEQHILIEHERGEVMIHQVLGTQWKQWLTPLLGTRVELMARAIRDHWTDCLTTLPYIASKAKEASIHFYFANLNHMRKDLFPLASKAYKEWQESKDNEVLIALAKTGEKHWKSVTTQLVTMANSNDKLSQQQIIEFLENERC